MRNFISGVLIVLGALGLIVTLYSPSHGEMLGDQSEIVARVKVAQ